MKKQVYLCLAFLFASTILTPLTQCFGTIKTINTVVFVKDIGLTNLDYYVVSENWYRNAETDLPKCANWLAFIVYAQDVFHNACLTATIDESSVMRPVDRLNQGNNEIKGVGIISEYEDFGVSYTLKSYLTAKTNRDFTYAYSEFAWSIDFPRYLNEEVASLYITPNNPTIGELEEDIMGGPKWFVLCNWVATNIEYKHDMDVHGQIEYWQLPTETFQLRTGDCEDFSILLCSLYRVNEYDESNAFVMAGPTNDLGELFFGETWHAWVRINIGGLWTDIEPQDPTGIVQGFLYDFLLFDKVYQFNDKSFQILK